MEEALIAYFLANSGVSALIGPRLRPTLSSQSDVAPRAALTTVSRQPVYHTGGQSDLAEARVQVDCMAQTAAGALALARAFKAAVPKAPFTTGGIEFSIFQLSERQSFEAETPTSKLHRVSIDFRVWHSEP